MTLPKHTLRRFGKETKHRRLMFQNLTASLILNGQITTTHEKAKELQRFAERIIRYAKLGTPSARLQALSFLNHNQEAVDTLFREYHTRFQYRNGGYTRVKPIGYRHGDAAKMSVIEYIRDDLFMQPSDYTCNLPRNTPQSIDDDQPVNLSRE